MYMFKIQLTYIYSISTIHKVHKFTFPTIYIAFSSLSMLSVLISSFTTIVCPFLLVMLHIELLALHCPLHLGKMTPRNKKYNRELLESHFCFLTYHFYFEVLSNTLILFQGHLNLHLYTVSWLIKTILLIFFLESIYTLLILAGKFSFTRKVALKSRCLLCGQTR